MCGEINGGSLWGEWKYGENKINKQSEVNPGT